MEKHTSISKPQKLTYTIHFIAFPTNYDYKAIYQLFSAVNTVMTSKYFTTVQDL